MKLSTNFFNSFLFYNHNIINIMSIIVLLTLINNALCISTSIRIELLILNNSAIIEIHLLLYCKLMSMLSGIMVIDVINQAK